MKTTVIVLIAMLFVYVSFSHAENNEVMTEVSSVEEQFQGLSLMSEFFQSESCPKLKKQMEQYKSEGKMIEAHAIKGSIKNACECFPLQVKNELSKLSYVELTARMSLSDFLLRYKPKIIDKCAAEQFRAEFSDGCAERMSKRVIDSENFCSCMSQKLSLLPDTKIANIGTEFTSHLPLVSDAKKNGLPPPEQPQGIKQLFEFYRSCNQGVELKFN
jgi:hypothetical protein